MRRRDFLAGTAATITAARTSSAAAQAGKWPDRPVKLILSASYAIAEHNRCDSAAFITRGKIAGSSLCNPDAAITEMPEFE